MAERARTTSGAAAVRLVRPGTLVTTDYREDRLTVTIDSAGRVVTARCG